MSDVCIFFFFFSSRRRHTRCSRDWSSDVCSSDLVRRYGVFSRPPRPAPNSFRLPAHQSRVAGFLRVLGRGWIRSEEHTSELQSRLHLVCRLLLEKKKKTITVQTQTRKCYLIQYIC